MSCPLKQFLLSVKSKYTLALHSVIGLKQLMPLSQPIRSKIPTNCDLSFDWMMAGCLSFVTGQCDNFDFSFTTFTQLKTALFKDYDKALLG